MELDITAHGGEWGLPDGGLAVHLEILNVVNLFGVAVALFDVPEPFVRFGERK
jgi:hypothetical protein